MKKLLAPVWMRLALNAYASGDYTAAEKHFRRVAAVDPERRGIRHNLALTAMGRGDFVTAESLLLAELEEQGDYYPRLRVLADLYYAWERYESAAAYYRRAAAEADAPGHDERLLRERTRICEDDRASRAAARSNHLYREGTARLSGGDTQSALECFETAVDLDPTNHPSLNNIGVIRMNTLGDYAGAAEAFEAALGIQPVEIVRANLARARNMLERAKQSPRR